MNEGDPFIRFDWIVDNLDAIGQRIGEHLVMVVAAVAIGFVVSFGLALVARRFRRTYGPILAVTFGVCAGAPTPAAGDVTCTLDHSVAPDGVTQLPTAACTLAVENTGS